MHGKADSILSEPEQLLWSIAGPGFTGLRTEELETLDETGRQQLFGRAVLALESASDVTSTDMEQHGQVIQALQSGEELAPDSPEETDSLIINAGRYLRRLVASKEEPVRVVEAESQPQEIECSDDELIATFRQGDQAGFEILWQRYQGHITTVAKDSLRKYDLGSHLLDDVVSDVSSTLYDWLQREWQPASLQAWLRTVTSNRVRSMLRHRRHVAATPFDPTDNSLLEPQLDTAQQSNGIDSLLDRLSIEAELSVIKELLGKMTLRQRQLIELRFGLGYDYAKIGEILGVRSDNSTLKSGTSGAVRKLRTLYIKYKAQQAEQQVDEVRERAKHRAQLEAERLRFARAKTSYEEYRDSATKQSKGLQAMQHAKTQAERAKLQAEQEAARKTADTEKEQRLRQGYQVASTAAYYEQLEPHIPDHEVRRIYAACLGSSMSSRDGAAALHMNVNHFIRSMYFISKRLPPRARHAGREYMANNG
jgi:RNA polymerase sigma factor (sigma-70 family)